MREQRVRRNENCSYEARNKKHEIKTSSQNDEFERMSQPVKNLLKSS